jgi:alpha-D-ribose 1-methylphosphonate 5-triphosphate synthase subunit PhnH
MTEALVIEGGFADPVFDGQRVFRATMDALANPGRVQPLGAMATPPAPLKAELAALALALCDHDSPVWLDAPLASAPAVADWLRFHTGAPITSDKQQAMFALISDPAAIPRLEHFALGTDEYPDRSTTLIIAVDSLENGPAFELRGPGIRDVAKLAPHPVPAGFAAQWAENRQRFPRGVDVILVAPNAVAGLPRTTRISEA